MERGSLVVVGPFASHEGCQLHETQILPPSRCLNTFIPQDFIAGDGKVADGKSAPRIGPCAAGIDNQTRSLTLDQGGSGGSCVDLADSAGAERYVQRADGALCILESG